MIPVDPEPVEDENEPEAEDVDEDGDGNVEEVGSDEELDSVVNLRPYLDPKIEFDSEDEQAMSLVVKVFRECIRGFF